MIESILWDNDGVLVDSERVFFEVTRSAFARLNLDLTEELWAARYLGEGRSSREIARSLGASPAAIDPVMNMRNVEHKIALRQPPPIRPKVPETLATLSGRVTMVMVTGCHREQLHLMHDGSGLLEFFDTIISGDDCSESKPSPEPYHTAVKSLHLDVEKCIAVEDSRRGLVSAIRAGIPCVVVPTELTESQDFTGALSVEQDVSGVLRYVL